MIWFWLSYGVTVFLSSDSLCSLSFISPSSLPFSTLPKSQTPHSYHIISFSCLQQKQWLIYTHGLHFIIPVPWPALIAPPSFWTLLKENILITLLLKKHTKIPKDTSDIYNSNPGLLQIRPLLPPLLSIKMIGLYIVIWNVLLICLLWDSLLSFNSSSPFLCR